MWHKSELTRSDSLWFVLFTLSWKKQIWVTCELTKTNKSDLATFACSVTVALDVWISFCCVVLTWQILHYRLLHTTYYRSSGLSAVYLRMLCNSGIVSLNTPNTHKSSQNVPIIYFILNPLFTSTKTVFCLTNSPHVVESLHLPHSPGFPLISSAWYTSRQEAAASQILSRPVCLVWANDWTLALLKKMRSGARPENEKCYLRVGGPNSPVRQCLPARWQHDKTLKAKEQPLSLLLSFCHQTLWHVL